MSVNNNEVERKEADCPEIEERMSRVKDIANDLEKIKDPEQRRAYLSAQKMEGEPNCTLPFRQKPYVKYSKQGTYVDKNGNPVHSGSPDAHIPYKEFKYDKKTD